MWRYQNLMKLKKVVAAGLSVLLLQTLMEPSMQFVAFGMDESVAIDNDGISSDIMEADDENLRACVHSKKVV